MQSFEAPTAPAPALPKGGGAIGGIGEKFAASPVTGTASLSVPLAASPGRAGLGPQLALSYDSGAGNGPFGFGWSLNLATITRKTARGLPLYGDAAESDVFILAGAEDLAPELAQDGAGAWLAVERTAAFGPDRHPQGGATYTVRRYRPRVEGLFARIERWTNLADPADVHWRSISRDNLLTIYGASAESRIADPADPARIFSWLICEARDDRGNGVVYEYAREDGAGVDLARPCERNRGQADDPRRAANRYLKGVRYGNRTPLLDAAGARPAFLSPAQRAGAVWLFELLFDYDEGHLADAPPDAKGRPMVTASAEPTRAWAYRPDPFSSYRAGFELRTTRLCRRALMLHHFPDEPEVGAACLVRSTELSYTAPGDPADASGPCYSFLRAVTHCGYRRSGDGYIKASLPPLEFAYTMPVVQSEVRELDGASLARPPAGVDGAVYQWADLYGDGAPGILAEQGGAWFYARNHSPLDGGAAFGPYERVAARPSVGLAGGQARLIDLEGGGQPDLVVLAGPTPGSFGNDGAEGWLPFRPFTTRPSRSLDDPRLRLVDLDGDGRADLFISEERAFVWHAGRGKAGFGPAQRVAQALDEERGPRLVFADGDEAIFLADFSGDGLSDLVRVRNGEVCYWPNLGYGRFGAKVAMDRAPLFDRPERFDRRRIRLADVDGSGAADIIYLHPDGARLYFNRSGDSWSDPERLPAFPHATPLAAVTVVDLLGNGTACLVWSSPLPGDGRSALRYVDLMGGQKPHLLASVVNNLGAETHVRYAPSTAFALRDRAAGRPWVSKLPFPVHCIERVETIDRVSGNSLVSRYAYHHGHYDGEERELRGFAMVERWDSESLAALSADGAPPQPTNGDPAAHVPPTLTRTWFHTGVYLGREGMADYFAGLRDPTDAGEYYREPGLSDAEARLLLLEDTPLPAGLADDELREACRALKGALLRQEVYALDGSAKEPHPYTVSEQSHSLRLLQPRAGQRHAVFFVHPREALTLHYERDPADPRVAHSLTLDVDDFGNVLRSAAVAYGRRAPDPELLPDEQAEQARTLVTLVESDYTNAVLQDAHYRAPLPAETRTYELTGPQSSPPPRVARHPLSVAERGLGGEVPLQKRLLAATRARYRPDDLGAAAGDAMALLPVGALEPLALTGESYRLAFGPGLAEALYGERVTPAVLAEGGYVELDGDGAWWAPAGRAFLSPGADDGPAAERAFAAAHFFAARRVRDPFGNAAAVAYDPYDLLVIEASDALGNTVRAANDYRTLQPGLVTDPNGNRSAVAFDALGLVVGTAVMGKADEGLGDTLDGFEADLGEAELLAHLTAPLAAPHAILQVATTRLLYDPYAYARTKSDARPQPAVVSMIMRETHRAELAQGEATALRQSFEYSDGFGRLIQQKIQAEPGPLDAGGAQAEPRWVGSGWTVYNNKGLAVRQYEPFFSATHAFELELRRGVSPIVCYDPVGRAVATLHPDHSWQKLVFDPWRQASWDANDTALIADPADDPDVGDHFARLPAAGYLPTWHAARAGGALGPHERAAAERTAAHAGTPARTYLDSLGRPFLTVAHNRSALDGAPVERFLRTRVTLDSEGRRRAVVDALGRTVMRYDYDMLGNVAHSASMEAGERWTLADAAGKPLRAWDSRGHAFRIEHDALRRPVRRSVRGDGPQADQRVVGRELLFEQTTYGESREGAEALNLRTRVWQVQDTAGIVTSEAYDFKGNPLRSARQLARDYRAVPDWSREVDLEEQAYAGSTTYDAINRPVTTTGPDGSVIRQSFNRAGLLEGLEANLRGELRDGQPVWTPFVAGVAYDAKGRRERISFGSGAVSVYSYDPLTTRLTRLQTTRGAERLQDLRYTYDPVGNITHIQDDAQQTLYFRNSRVVPHGDYSYDALYQLIEATGREHLGQQGGAPHAPDGLDGFHTGRPHPGDGAAMGRYSERYSYDDAGNLLAMAHQAATGSWTRSYAYAEPSLSEPGLLSNRLSATTIGGVTETYSYDAHGSMAAMPHLPLLRWDFLDRLQASSQQAVGAGGGGQEAGGAPETTYYVYNGAGQRVRKVTERQAALKTSPPVPLSAAERGSRAAAGVRFGLANERIYLGGVELYRAYGGAGALELERETLHVTDGAGRLALVETQTLEASSFILHPSSFIRYQHGNQLGSACLELDGAGRVISYEEYYPYGATAYQAVDASIKAAAKRYRYTGMERDEESGLAYHGARYYAPWLGRWTSADPAGLAGGANLYAYVRNDPVNRVDPGGLSDEQAIEYPPGTPTPGEIVVYGKRQEAGFWGNLGKAAAFGAGVLTGLVAGVATAALVAGAIAALPISATAAAVIGIGLGVAAAGVAGYELYKNWEGVKAKAARLTSGDATAGEYFGAGVVVGGIVSIPLGGKASAVGKPVGAAVREALFAPEAWALGTIERATAAEGAAAAEATAAAAATGSGLAGEAAEAAAATEATRAVGVTKPGYTDWFHRKIPGFRTLEPGTSQLNLPFPERTSIRTVLSGHGVWNKKQDGFFELPRGTTLTVYAKKGQGISERLGQAVELDVDLAGVYQRVYRGGSLVPNLTLHPPTGLRVMGIGRTVTNPTLLSDLVGPNLGEVHWAACFHMH